MSGGSVTRSTLRDSSPWTGREPSSELATPEPRHGSATTTWRRSSRTSEGSSGIIVKTTTYITHWAYRPLVAVARDEVFPAPPYPANTLVVVQGLAEPHFLVEIEAIAVL